MKHISSALLLLLMVLTAGCEKDIATEDDKDDGKGNDTTPAIVVGTEDDAPENYSTVAEAIEAEPGSYLCVKGYIVASTQRSMDNARFEAPFSGSSAIVLADEPVSDTTFPEDLLPVCLTDCQKGIRSSLNLVDNPDNWNHIVYITGWTDRYLSVPGLKMVQQYVLIE